MSEPRGHRPPPPWYGWTIKLLLAVTAFLAVVSLTTLAVYATPTIATLARETASQKAQDDCYDAFSARVSEQNAAVTVALGDMVVQLSRPVAERDQAAIKAAVGRIDAASQGYTEAVEARAAFLAAGRPIPCAIPIPPN